MKYLANDELSAFLGEAKRASELHWAMFILAYWHGLRATEVVGGWLISKKRGRTYHEGLTRQSFANGFLTVQRLKGSEKTTQALVKDPDPLLNERAAVLTLVEKHHDDSRIFPFCRSYYFRLFRKYAKRAGLPAHKWHPHTLKHTVAMDHIEVAGIHNVKKRLGHKSLGSTGIYLGVTDEQASAAFARARKKSTDAA